MTQNKRDEIERLLRDQERIAREEHAAASKEPAKQELERVCAWLEQRAYRIKDSINERLVPAPIDSDPDGLNRSETERKYGECYRELLVANGLQQAAKDLLEGKEP